MHITCTTPRAAAQVIEILFSTGLHTVHDFTMRPILSTTTPPLIFTMLIALTAAQVTKISAVADTTIGE
jgi:hypothetical protein